MMSDAPDTDIDMDDDDWMDLQRVGPGAAMKPDVTLRLSQREGHRARAWLAFRRGAGDFVREHAPRFRSQIGGRDADRIRLIKDHERGQFECMEFKGTMRIGLGHVNLWPNEVREPVSVDWQIVGNALLLKVPEGFAKPARLALPPPAAPAAPPAVAPKSVPPKPPSRPAPVPLGELGPGRSALDERRRREGRG